MSDYILEAGAIIVIIDALFVWMILGKKRPISELQGFNDSEKRLRVEKDQ